MTHYDQVLQQSQASESCLKSSPVAGAPTPAAGFAICPQHQLLARRKMKGWKLELCPPVTCLAATIVRQCIVRHPGASSSQIARLLRLDIHKTKLLLTSLLRAGRIVRHADRSAYWVLDRQKVRKP